MKKAGNVDKSERVLGSRSFLRDWPKLFRAAAMACLVTFALPAVNIVPIYAYTGDNLPVYVYTGTGADEIQRPNTGILDIEITDSNNNPLAGAKITVYGADGNQVGSVYTTDEKGLVRVPALAVGEYRLLVEAIGFQAQNETGITVENSAMSKVTIQVTQPVSGDVVEVKAESDRLIEQTANPQGQLTQTVLKMVPLLSQDFTAALPLVPNVIRPPDGKVSIKGAREDQSALLINNADATDPATGNFALSIPLESIERVNVFTNPYLPEFGKFTGGVVKVETKRGGDKFKFSVDDFFPEPRFRGGQLFGFANVSPRIHLEGPILKDKIFFSQGFEFGVDKKPVRGLPSPINEIKRKDARSFTQLDFILSAKQTLTITSNYSVRRTDHLNLDFFNPQTVAPNQKVQDYSLGAIDRLSLANGSLIETVVQYKRISSQVFGEGPDLMDISPFGRTGNFFHRDERTTDRFEISSTDTLPAMNINGVHNIKFGVDVAYLSNIGSSRNQDVTLTRADGTKAQQIHYFTTGTLNATNAQISAFAQDQWLIKPNLSFDYGLRVEAQRTTAGISAMPRAALAYSPGTKGNTVLKAAIGLFYDKVPLNAVNFRTQAMQSVTTFGLDGQTIVDGPRNYVLKFAPRPNGGAPNDGNSFSAPRNTTFSLEFNQRVTPKALLKVAYLDSRTRNDLYVSPIITPTENVIMLFNNGRGRYRSLEVTTNVDLPQGNNVSFSYIRSKAKGELNDFNSYFGDLPEPVIRDNQFGNLSSDAPHRFLARGTMKLPYQFTIVPLLDVHTGFPYSIRDESQNFVGTRNSVRFPRFASLDMAFIKDVRIRDKYKAQFTLNLFNVTSHFNPRNVRNNTGDPNFGQFFSNYRRFYRVDFAFEW